MKTVTSYSISAQSASASISILDCSPDGPAPGAMLQLMVERVAGVRKLFLTFSLNMLRIEVLYRRCQVNVGQAILGRKSPWDCLDQQEQVTFSNR